MAIITRHRRKIIVKIIVSLIVVTVILYFAGKIYAINSVSELKRDSVPVEIVTIDAKTPENPYDYGDCIADLPWDVELFDPESTMRINKDRQILFHYSSHIKTESLYDSISEDAAFNAFFEQNNIYSDEDLTCYLYGYNSNDISMKYLFKPIKKLNEACFVCRLQAFCSVDAEKVYDVRNGDLRAIVEVLKYEDITSYMINIASPINMKTLSFSIRDEGSSLTEEDIFKFISTISFKEE